MRFEELPYEVQMIAAKTLSDRFPSAGSSKSNGFEPATALARDVKAAFIELYLPPEPASTQSGSDLKDE
ncbi:formyltetrahydrofolate deformylase [Yersinia enterocolitica]